MQILLVPLQIFEWNRHFIWKELIKIHLKILKPILHKILFMYHRILLIHSTWDRTGGSLLNILYSRMVSVLTYRKFLQAIVCYCFYIWAVQVTRGVFHLDISYVCWFKVIGPLFFVFWSFDSWRSWWSGRQAVRRYHSGWSALLETVLNVCLRSAFLMKELSSCENKNVSLGTPQVPDLDCQDFGIIGCWININLL